MAISSKTVLMVHAAFGTSASFDHLKEYFEARGWTCHAPNLPFHGPKAQSDPAFAAASIRDYTNAMADFAEGLDDIPVVIGHSLGGLIAQQLAARRLAKALILLSPNAPWGVLPTSDEERAVAVGLMSAGPFWKDVMHLDFDLEATYALNMFPPDEQRTVFDSLQGESGRVVFEMFFWMFDNDRSSFVDFESVQCPVLIVSGTEDRVLAPETAQEIARRYGKLASLYRPKDHGHFLLMEPGWEVVAAHCERWLTKVLPA